MFNRVWRLFNDRILDHVLSETKGTAVIELTTELNNTLKMLENPKQMIEDEMDRSNNGSSSSNLARDMLDTKIVILLPYLEDKVEEFPNDPILAMFYSLLETGWKRYLQIIMNYTSPASSILHWQMNVSEEREPDAMQKYINKLTIRTAFATFLWNNKMPAWVRNNVENNKVMILFYWYNKSAIDLDYPERYTPHMTLEQQSKYYKTKTKLHEINNERNSIIKFYHSIYNKLVTDTQDMFNKEREWALRQQQQNNDPETVIHNIQRAQTTLQSISDVIEVDINQLRAEHISSEFTLSVEDEGDWALLLNNEQTRLRTRIVSYIDRVSGSDEDPQDISDSIREIKENGVPRMISEQTEIIRVEQTLVNEQEQEQDEKGDSDSEMEHKYDKEIEQYSHLFQEYAGMDTTERMRHYSSAILMYSYYYKKWKYLKDGFLKYINDTIQLIEPFATNEHGLANHFINFIKTNVLELIQNTVDSYERIVHHLEPKYRIAIQVRKMEYRIQVHQSIQTWLSRIQMMDNNSIDEIKRAVDATHISMDKMKRFREEEYKRAHFGKEEETKRNNKKWVSNEEIIDLLEFVRESINEYNKQGLPILLKEQQKLIAASNIRSIYKMKTFNWLDEVLGSDANNGWQLTRVPTVDSDDRSSLISIIEQDILSVEQRPVTIEHAYNHLQDFSYLDQSLSRANLNEIWSCILNIWKIIVATNPSDIITSQ